MPQQYSGESPWRRTREVTTVPSPAAGADWSYTVPGDRTLGLIAVQAQLVTDANVANRAPVLTLGDGNLTYLQLPAQAVIAAGTTRLVTWAVGTPAYAAGNGLVTPLPHLVLEPGWTLSVVTGSVQAGDQWSAVRILGIVTTVRGGPVDLRTLPDMIVAMIGAEAGG